MGEPYVKVPLWVLMATDLKPQSRLLLEYMINFRSMNGDGKALCKSAKGLGEALGIPTTTVKRSIAELESRGLIEVQKGHVSSYRVQSNMDRVQSNMDQSQSNMDQSQSNMDRVQSNMDRPYTSIYKINNKNNSSKLISKSARAREREEMQYSPDLFNKRKFMKLACNPPTYQHGKTVYDYREEADLKFKDPEWWSR